MWQLHDWRIFCLLAPAVPFDSQLLSWTRQKSAKESERWFMSRPFYFSLTWESIAYNSSQFKQIRDQTEIHNWWHMQDLKGSFRSRQIGWKQRLRLTLPTPGTSTPLIGRGISILFTKPYLPHSSFTSSRISGKYNTIINLHINEKHSQLLSMTLVWWLMFIQVQMS